ncbi:hypothetical protein B0I37DRAFT_89683 [Chaetomium sp. MPI-CAGE-AT-0009]|nr:hypothetical protein B0I37DRAFT_89683 [Chaetomium sp. MPI-CAGE-AT-0009]
MNAKDWTRTVFRLRRVPNHVSTPAEVASLLSGILNLPSDHVIVYSVAGTAEFFAAPSKVATLQIKSVPACLQQSLKDNEWELPTAEGKAADSLILDTHFEGITILSDPPPFQHHADCIAISGLASHPFGSWQPRGPDKTFMWIRDAIPAALHGVRTAIYGYDSKLTDTRSFQSISDIARGMILHLKSGGWNRPSSKPIVFLAHSLGGLVLKEAIVQMADRDESVSSILRNVQGAIMFGVPSLGMEQSHLMAMVEGQPNDSLVQDLSRYGGGDYVRELNTRFEGLSFLGKGRIHWAYETKESPTVIQRPDGSWDRCGPHRVLVNPESATFHNCRKDKSVTIPIGKDHSSMVKFGRGDTYLGIITNSIAEICPTAQLTNQQGPAGLVGVVVDSTAAQDLLGPRLFSAGYGECNNHSSLIELGETLSALEELHAELFSTQLNFRLESIDDPFKDTFNWVFDLPVFSQWLQEGSGLFWIHGKPGSGKSTLMKLIFQHRQTWELLHNWQRKSLEVIAGFFFHYRGSTIQKSFEGVIRSLILQILAPVRDPYLKLHKPTWKRYKSAREKLARQKSELAHIQGLVSDTARALEEVSGELSRLRLSESSAQTDVQDATADIARQIALQESRQESLKVQEAKHRAEGNRVESEIDSLNSDLTALEESYKPFEATRETRFLKDVATAFRNGRKSDELIPRLERLLQQLLDQTTMDMDAVLFFDALDEYDGHIDMISRFMKTLLRDSTASRTRVKVCMSSRPWESLKAHFASCPGFAVQDYTAHDMEEYAVGSVSVLPGESNPILRLIPTILERANGVFLWVKLAIGMLLETATPSPESASPDALEKRLEELPDDLFEFYEMIVQRIAKRNRRCTFALLELLIRSKGPPAEAYQIRDAVLVSHCKTFDEAVEVLQTLTPWNPGLEGEVRDDRCRDDIHTWSGGLVEIKSQNGILRPQLLHQTVLEFTMGLSFKKMVVGDLASLLEENGHSFHVKYWITERALRIRRSPVEAERSRGERSMAGRPWVPFDIDNDPILDIRSEEKPELEIFAFHAEQSELTTGKSQLEFLCGVPYDKLGLFTRICRPWHTTLAGGRTADFEGPTSNITKYWDTQSYLPSFAAAFGLSLCLRDWGKRNQRDDLGGFSEPWPLLSSLVFFPPSGVFHARHLITARLVLENGFKIQKDPFFFPRILEELWVARSSNRLEPEQPTNKIATSALLTLAKLALDHCQDPNVKLIFFRDCGISECRPLHVAPPQLATELIRHGADPTMGDSRQRRPIHWILQHPARLWEENRLSCAERYEMCNILVNATDITKGAVVMVPLYGAARTLAEFDREGYDTSFLRSNLPVPSFDTDSDLTWKADITTWTETDVANGIEKNVANRMEADVTNGMEKAVGNRTEKDLTKKKWYDKIRRRRKKRE